jgi:hypothetical protein
LRWLLLNRLRLGRRRSRRRRIRSAWDSLNRLTTAGAKCGVVGQLRSTFRTKHYFRPILPASPEIKSPDSRMLLNPKPAGQSANAAVGWPFNSNAQYPGSHDDAFFVVGPCVEDQRIAIRPRKNLTHNENTRKHQQKLHSSSAVA